MTVMAPKNAWELSKMLEFSAYMAGPCAIRYPRGGAYQGLEEFQSPVQYGKSEILYRGEKTAILSVGSMTEVCEQVYREMKAKGENPTFETQGLSSLWIPGFWMSWQRITAFL